MQQSESPDRADRRQRIGPPAISRNESGQDPRSEEQISRIADAWIEPQIKRFGPKATLALAATMKGDQPLYRAVIAKLKDREPGDRPRAKP